MMRRMVGACVLTSAGVAAWLFFATREAREPRNLPVRLEALAEEIPGAGQESIANAAVPKVIAGSADASDIAALDVATVVMCHRQVSQRQGLQEVDCEKFDESATYDRQICERYREYLDEKLPHVTAAAARCPEELAEPSIYYRALRDLASRGDVIAQRCFIQGYFGIDREAGVHLTKAEYEEYPGLARRYIAAAFERGDWSVVRWLSKSRVEMSDLMLANAHPIGLDDRVNAYQIRRLLMLGNQPGLGTMDQDDPERLVELWRREKWLSVEELEAAEGWAQDMYRQHFIGSQEGAGIDGEEFCPDE